MKNLFLLTVVAFAVCASSVSAQTNSGVFTPDITERGKPLLLDKKKYPIEQWKSKSTTNYNWFVETPDGWYLDWDAERQKLNHFIVRQTKSETNMTPEEVSDIHRDYYVAAYDDLSPKTPYVYGLPVHSSHIVDGKETFIGFHYAIYSDGTYKTTLVPHREMNGELYVDMIGWGLGNWQMSCRSVQVAMIGDYTTEWPSKEALQTLKQLMGYYRSKVPDLVVNSHDAVRTAGPKQSPGSWFNPWLREIGIEPGVKGGKKEGK